MAVIKQCRRQSSSGLGASNLTTVGHPKSQDPFCQNDDTEFPRVFQSQKFQLPSSYFQSDMFGLPRQALQNRSSCRRLGPYLNEDQLQEEYREEREKKDLEILEEMVACGKATVSF